MERQELNSLINKATETDNQIRDLQSENRIRMCEAIVEIVKEHGGKIKDDEFEEVLEDTVVITFVSQDGTYYNDFCNVYSIETFEMHDGKMNFTIDCYDSYDYPEWNLSYDNIAALFEAVTDWYAAKG